MTFAAAFAIGFSVASIPGPTIFLITTETLTKGSRAGLATMLAPLLIDALLMVPLGLSLQGLFTSPQASQTLAILGGCFLAWLGLNSIRAGMAKLQTRAELSHNRLAEKKDLPSFLKGVITHLSSPYPYLYWATAGAHFIRQGFARDGLAGALLFPLSFWLGSSAFTITMIILAAQGKRLLPPRLEPWLHCLSGFLLIASGIYVIVQSC